MKRKIFCDAFQFTTSISDCQAPLIIEAIIEKIEIKVRPFH